MSSGRNRLHTPKRELKAEVEDLRERLKLNDPLTIEEWEASMPQAMRDTFAARALVNEYGNREKALIRLGFPYMDDVPVKERPDFREIHRRVFETEGVKTILNIGELAEYQKPILMRQAEIALHGDPTNATRAAQVISRCMGWQKVPDIHLHQNRQTIYALVNQKNSRGEIPSETVEALADDFLTHEPGGPQRIDSGDDKVLAALNPGYDGDLEDEDG